MSNPVKSANMIAVYHEVQARPLFGKGGPVVCSLRELRTVHKMTTKQLNSVKKHLAKQDTYTFCHLIHGFFYIQLCP